MTEDAGENMENLENGLQHLQLIQHRAKLLEKYIHTNECSDEMGWFAFFTPKGKIGDCEMMGAGLYANGCDTEEEAIKTLVEMACEALKTQAAEKEKYRMKEYA